MVRQTMVVLLIVFFILGNYNSKDISQAVDYYGNTLSSTHPVLMEALIVILIIYLLLNENLLARKKIRPKT